MAPVHCLGLGVEKPAEGTPEGVGYELLPLSDFDASLPWQTEPLNCKPKPLAPELLLSVKYGVTAIRKATEAPLRCGECCGRLSPLITM